MSLKVRVLRNVLLAILLTCTMTLVLVPYYFLRIDHSDIRPRSPLRRPLVVRKPKARYAAARFIESGKGGDGSAPLWNKLRMNDDESDDHQLTTTQEYSVPQLSPYGDEAALSPEQTALFCPQTAYADEPQADYQIQDIWKNITEPTNMRMMYSDDFWFKLDRIKPKRSKKTSERLKIIVVPHSHVDPGWLRTFKSYSNDTDTILDNMLQFMSKNKRMTFQWGEMSFFAEWWTKLKPVQRQAVGSLVEQGQLEFTSGSWVMTDEANPHYWSTIDNIITGHQFLHEEALLDDGSSLGTKSSLSVVWTNDPFGYGTAAPFLFSLAGAKYYVINRIHRQIKLYLEQSGAVPFMWKQLWDNEQRFDMLTSVLPFLHYDIPNSCGPDPAVCCQFDFKRITHFYCPGPTPTNITRLNVRQKASLLLKNFRLTAKVYNVPLVLMTLGDDFRYDMMQEWHQQHDNYVQLMDYMNSKSDWNVEFKFGTFNEYFTDMEKWYAKSGNKPPSVSGDFFPYSDNNQDYWTGYFTSRPFYKHRERELMSLVRAADILLSWKRALQNRDSDHLATDILKRARRNLALFQHHDAITGTSKVHVMRDYGTRLLKALNDVSTVVEHSAAGIITSHYKQPKNLQLGHRFIAYNESTQQNTIQLKTGESMKLYVFNSLAQPRLRMMKVRVTTSNIRVTDSEGAVVRAQINPLLDYASGTSTSTYELIFKAHMVQLGFTKFVLFRLNHPVESTEISQVFIKPYQPNTHNGYMPRPFTPKTLLNKDISISNSRIFTHHSWETGLLESVEYKNSKRNSEMLLSIHEYQNTRSGPYIFASNSQKPKKIPMLDVTIIKIQGPVVQELHVFAERFHHILRLYELPAPEGDKLNLETTVDVSSLGSVEVVMRIKTGVSDDNGPHNFYTDSNGIQLLKRTYRPQYPVEASYYPMPTAAVLQNRDKRLTVVGDHPHGATSPAKGQLEIMLDRIHQNDDNKGLGSDRDSLGRDNVPVTSRFTVMMENYAFNSATPAHHIFHTALGYHASQDLLYPPVLLLSRGTQRGPSGGSAAPLSLLPNAPFACDMELVNIRPSSDTDHQLLIVRRAGLDCGTSTLTPAACNGTQQQPSQVIELMKQLGVKRVQRMNLSGTRAAHKAAETAVLSALPEADLVFQPNDINTYRITF